MFEAPKQEATKYTEEQLTQMVPAYMALMDAQDEEGGVNYLKDKFDARPVDIIRFAGMVATVIDDRKQDKSPEVDDADTGVVELVRTKGSEGEAAGQADQLEPVLPAQCDNNPAVGSDS